MDEKYVFAIGRPHDVDVGDFGDVLRFGIAPQLIRSVPGITEAALTLHDGEAPAPLADADGTGHPVEAAIQFWTRDDTAAGAAVEALRESGSTVQGWRVRERRILDAREPLPPNTPSPWIRFLPFMERLDDVSLELFDANWAAHGQNLQLDVEEFRAELGVDTDSAVLMRRGLWRYMQNLVLEPVTDTTYWRVDGIGELDRIGRSVGEAAARLAKQAGSEEEAKAEFARRAARPNRFPEQPYYKMHTRRVRRGRTYEFFPS